MESNTNIVCVHVNIPISNYIAGYRSKLYTMPVWQRHDSWNKDFRKELIQSIHINIDLPKIYIGEFKTKQNIIIDGGHRTRAIDSYMNNQFYITIGLDYVFYNSLSNTKALKNKRVMTEYEKGHFDNYKLTIAKYENITERNCRHIFNILQNAQPMSVADVMNSWESDLVDYLRSLQDMTFRAGQRCFSLYTYFGDSRCLPNPENNEIIYQLASFFTILFPQENNIIHPDTASTVSMKHLEKGKTRKSPCLNYVKDFKEELDDEMKQRFQESLLKIVKFLFKKKMSMADINSYYYSSYWITGFSENLFIEFVSKADEYLQLKTQANKNNKSKKYKEAEEKNVEADSINTDYDGMIEEWVKSRTSGGSGYKGMKTRYDIIIKYCVSNSEIEQNESELDNSITIEQLGTLL